MPALGTGDISGSNIFFSEGDEKLTLNNEDEVYTDLVVSIHGGSPKWMVYKGKPWKTLFKWMI